MAEYLDAKRIIGNSHETKPSNPSTGDEYINQDVGLRQSYDGSDWQPTGGWVELGRASITAEADDITVNGLANKKYLMVLCHQIQGTANPEATIRFNGDSGSNYRRRNNVNGGSDSTDASASTFIPVNGGSEESFGVQYIYNVAGEEKLLIGHETNRDTNVASSDPHRFEAVGKWVNTTDAINSITYHNNTGSSGFGAGSEIVVLGWDPSDTHVDNFWKELDRVDKVNSTDDGGDLITNVFTPKKYMRVMAYLNTDGNDPIFRVGHDTVDSGGNYASRTSTDGAADVTATSATNVDFGNTTTNCFFDLFFINSATDDKICVGHSVYQNTAGAGTEPKRLEIGFKWIEVTDQINIMSWTKTTPNYTGHIRVWGHD